MARLVLNVIAPLTALVCCVASAYLIVPLALAHLDLSRHGPGLRGVLAAAVLLPTAVLGIVAGLFLYPLIVRPVVSDSAFWAWLPKRAPINLPLVSPLLLRWYEYLYGPRHV